MHLSRLTLSGFRNLDCEVSFCPGFAMLTGENNAELDEDVELLRRKTQVVSVNVDEPGSNVDAEIPGIDRVGQRLVERPDNELDRLGDLTRFCWGEDPYGFGFGLPRSSKLRRGPDDDGGDLAASRRSADRANSRRRRKRRRLSALKR